MRAIALTWPGTPGRLAHRHLAIVRPLAGRAPRRRVGGTLRAVRASGQLGLLLLAMLLALAMLSQPARVAVKTALVVPEMLADAPIRPLLWVTPPPAREELSYQSPTGQVDVDIYRPGWGGRHGAVILYTGAFGLRRDPAFVRFGEALARSGAIVMVPESATLRTGAIDPGDVAGLVQAVGLLRARPDVDPERIGIIGFSAGGSIVLLAAEDEVGREQIAFVNVFGAYYDARELLISAMSREIVVDGQPVPWEPNEVTVYTAARQVIAGVPEDADREILWRAYLDHDPDARGALGRLSPTGQLVRELLDGPSRERAAAIVDALPAGWRERIDAVSPRARVDRLKARVYVMHGRADGHIPCGHARALVAEAPAGTIGAYSELELFRHVLPDQQLSRPALAREIAKLAYHAWLVGREYL